MTTTRPRLHVVVGTAALGVRWVAERRLLRDILTDVTWRCPSSAGCCYDRATITWHVPFDQRYCLSARPCQWLTTDTTERVDHIGAEFGRRGKTGAGRQSYGAGGGPPEVVSAVAMLHLLPTAPLELATAAHCIAIKQVRPDAGGQHEEAVKVNAASATIRTHHARRAS